MVPSRDIPVPTPRMAHGRAYLTHRIPVTFRRQKVVADNVKNDWDLRSEKVQKNQVAAYDEMRRRCPVAHDEFMGYSVFKNTDVQHVLDHPEIYSNVVSTRHIAVPNGMDAPEHTTFRAVNDKYFTPERLREFEPKIREVVKNLVANLPRAPRLM